MPNELTAVARAILDALLDQFEQRDRRRVARVRLNEQQHREYFHPSDFSIRRETNDALQQLEEHGCLKLHWRKWEENNWLEKVDLFPESAATVYETLRRTPRNAQQSALRDLLSSQSPAPGWYADFLAWALSQSDADASVAPLKLSDDPANTQWNNDLLLALAALARLSAPTLERKFSVQLFGDSKRFDELRGAVLKVLRRHNPESSGYGDDDKALLRAHMLERAPEYVPISGPLVLQTEEALLDLTPFGHSVAVPATTLRNATVKSCDAKTVVTIENITSFSEFAVAKPASILAIFTGGFASPAIIALLRNIRAAHSDLSFFHWGDMDAGGLRILAHLRKSIGAIEPLAMDVTTFDSYRKHAQPLNRNERDALRQLRKQTTLADCASLIERLLEADRKLEQEAVDVSFCLTSIAIAPSIRHQ
jgi:hypothetical protein